MNEDNPDSLPSRMIRFVAEITGARFFPSLPLRKIFTALRYPNFRLWFLGQVVSLVGTWMQTAAQGFLVFELTHSSAYLGYVGFATGVPSFFLILFGGVYADRMSRRKLLLITQTVMMILAFTLAGITFLGIVKPWHIIILALFVGLTNAFDAPTRHAIVPELVDRQDLSNAIALNSSMFNLGVLVGPAVAGLVYVKFGPAWCFGINGISFIAAISALAKMRLKPFISKSDSSAPLDDFKKGLRYAMAHQNIRILVSIVAVMCLFGTVYMTLIPAWAVRVLGGDAATNGWLLSTRGIGALSGAIMIAALGRFQFKGKLLTVGKFIFPIMLLIFANLRSVPLSLLTMVGVGWGFMITFNMLNSLIQSEVADEYRGRVVSLYTFCIFGLNPIGALLAGWEAEFWGEPIAIIISAGITLTYSAWVFYKAPQLRQLH